MTFRGSTSVPERLFASLPYVLPLIDGVAYGGSFFKLFPDLTVLLLPLLPFGILYSFPFASIIVFFALFFLVVRNEKIPHFIRFNTMQALLVDILIFIIGIMIRVLGGISGLQFIVTTLSNFIFLGVVAVVIYSVAQSLRGLYAEIPTISDAVYMQVR